VNCKIQIYEKLESGGLVSGFKFLPLCLFNRKARKEIAGSFCTQRLKVAKNINFATLREIKNNNLANLAVKISFPELIPA
jgi:hypothetical protein